MKWPHWFKRRTPNVNYSISVTLPANVIRLDERRPHAVAELACIHCAHRWVGVFPAPELLKDLRCPGCMKTGGVIKTGQPLYDDPPDGGFHKGGGCA